jgi:predicted PurR-regulated permease PerM
MANAESVLVIIVSLVLTIFLVVAIIILLLVAKLISEVRRIVERGEQLLESASEATEMLKNASGPLALFKLVRNIMRAVDNKRK